MPSQCSYCLQYCINPQFHQKQKLVTKSPYNSEQIKSEKKSL